MIKVLFDFTINKEESVEKQEQTTNESGEKVTVTKTVKESVPHKYFVARASRMLLEEAELYKAAKFSEAVKRGILTHDLLSKRLKNDDGILSDEEKEKYKEMYNNLYTIQMDVQKINSRPEKDWTPEEKIKFDELVNKLRKQRQELRDFETSKSSLFELTAETYARNKMVFWYLMYLSYKANAKGEPEPMFPGKSFEEKAAKYDELEEKNDLFLNQSVQKLMYYITLWFVSEVSNPEQFAQLVKETEDEDKRERDAYNRNEAPAEPAKEVSPTTEPVK